MFVEPPDYSRTGILSVGNKGSHVQKRNRNWVNVLAVYCEPEALGGLTSRNVTRNEVMF